MSESSAASLAPVVVKTVVPRKPKSNRCPLSAKFEKQAREQGYVRIAGLDEVGRGPLAGPVVAAIVILTVDYKHPRLNDSKKLTHEHRVEVRDHLLSTAGIVWALGETSVEEIDTLNIYHASFLAMRRALEKLAEPPDFLFIDGNRGLRGTIPEQPIVDGDAKCRSIAAASILAKVHRDTMMEQLHQTYPQYGFAQHKGYATAAHRAAIQTHGLTPIHRRSFCCD